MKKYIIFIIATLYFIAGNQITFAQLAPTESSKIIYDNLNGNFRILNNKTSTDGECGSSNLGTFDEAPTSNLCTTGNPTNVLGTGPWNWTCEGIDSGVTVNCSASKTYTGGNPTTDTTIPEDPNVTVETPTPEEPVEEPTPDELPVPEEPVEVPAIDEPLEEPTPDEPKDDVELEEKKIDYSKIKGETLIKKYPELLIKTGTPIFERVKTLKSSKIETSLPTESFKGAGNYNENVDFWKESLPVSDKNAEKILVVPSNGLVIPIISVDKSSSDYKKAISGEEFDYLNTMKNGALEYPGTSVNSYGEVGNKVVFGHSSYWKNDDGRYKTHFQKIIELDKGEEVWVFEKSGGINNYKRHVYITQKSYNTSPDDSEIMKPGVGRKLTLVTCTPIGGISGRWIIKAELKEDVDYRESIKQENLRLKKLENIVDSYFSSLLKKDLDSEKLKELLKNIYLKLDEKSRGEISEDLKYLISYFKKRILDELKNIK